MSYDQFLSTKISRAKFPGIEPASLHGAMFPYQVDIVSWALRAGRAAIFADTGLGKTLMQLAWADAIKSHSGGDVLIICPLAVANQTAAESARFGIDASISRDGLGSGIVITNYEMVHRFDADRFSGVVLDESSILKSYDGATTRRLIDAFCDTPYRLACTATPAPNDHTELGNHAEFLGVCSRVEMLSEYFVHDGGSTADWRLKGHAQVPFWQWVAGWGAFVRTPADLGYDATQWVLPPLTEQTMPIEESSDIAWGSGFLFGDMTRGLSNEREARRGTLESRVHAIADAIRAEPNDQAVVWCDLNAESASLTSAIDGAVELAGSEDPDVKAQKMMDFAAGKIHVLVTKAKIAGFGMNWQNCARCYFIGPSHSYEQTYQAIRRFWRYGQSREVIVRTCVSPSDRATLSNIKRKTSDADMMSESLRRVATRIATQTRIHNTYVPTKAMEIPAWIASIKHTEESGQCITEIAAN